METDRIKSANGKCQVPTLHIPNEVKVKNVKMPFLIQSDNIIKQAEAYSKELDHVRMNNCLFIAFCFEYVVSIFIFNIYSSLDT